MKVSDTIPQLRDAAVSQKLDAGPLPARSETAKHRTVAVAALLSLSLWLLLSLLGQYILHEFQLARFANLTRAGSLYIEGFLTNDARDLTENGELSPNRKLAMQTAFDEVAVASHLDALLIWGTDGKMIFASTDGAAHGHHAEPVRRVHADRAGCGGRGGRAG